MLGRGPCAPNTYSKRTIVAKALTYRQLASIYQKQADIYTKLAKSQLVIAKALPQDNSATDDQLKAAIDAYDKCIRQNNTADSMQAQADNNTQLADAAGEPP